MSPELSIEKEEQRQRLIRDLKTLTGTPSVSGNEEKYGKFLSDYLFQYTGSLEVDSAGNVIAKKGNPQVYIFTHMDSIGFLVSAKEKERVKVVSVKEKSGRPTKSSWKIQILIGDGAVRANLSKPDKKRNLSINLTKDNLEKVNIGDFVCIEPNFRTLRNGLVKSQGLDNKLGILAGVETFKKSENVGLVVTTQEETTGIGAIKAVYDLKPKAVIVLDTTYDESGQDIVGPVIGGGPSICLKDSLFPDKSLVRKLIESGKRANIPLQYEVLDTGFSDANKIHSAWGYTPFVFVGIPIKNMHSPNEIGSIEDVISTTNLLAEFLKNY